VRQVFQGDALHWGDLGLGGHWAQAELHPCGLRPELALGIFLRERVGLGPAFGPSFEGFPQSADVVARVGQERNGIGFTAINRVTPAVKVIAIAPDEHALPVSPTEDTIRAGHYPLDRYLLIYARRPLEPLVREYLRLVLSREGQEAIAADALGYLPLNAAEATAESGKL